jgi:predicted solute-binding protein
MGALIHKKDLSIGWIPYWNLHPLKCEILKHTNTPKIISAHPSQINNWLMEGKIDLAPCSSVCLFKYPQFEMAIPCGVAATGSVSSVYWGFQQEHQKFVAFIKSQKTKLKEIINKALIIHPKEARQQVKYIHKQSLSLPRLSKDKLPGFSLSSASTTSVALTKILMTLLLGKESYQRMLIKKSINPNNKPAQLLIGDEALMYRNNFDSAIDLGEFWYDLTSKPFVYAVWQAKGAALNGWRKFLIEMSSIAEKKIAISPADYLNSPAPCDKSGKDIELLKYWKNIRYCLQQKDIESLILFLCLFKETEEKALAEDLLKKIERWSNKSPIKDYSF